MYYVTYRELETTTEVDHDRIQALPTEAVELEDVIHACQDLHCNAALYNAAGCAKGWVHADGTYQLR